MQTHNYEKYASRYAQRQILSSDYVAFRDLPGLFSRLNIKGKALDYGCGAGRSTRFLKTHGFETVGIDIDPAMLAQARREDPNGRYFLVNDSTLPFSNASFDLVFSSYVVLELSSKEVLTRVMRESVRVLRDDGYLIVITNTPEFYSGKWVSCEVEFPENTNPLKSGQQVRVRLMPEGVELFDYFWADVDYKEIFSTAGLRLLEEHRPLGSLDDPIAWHDEVQVAPYVVYVLQK